MPYFADVTLNQLRILSKATGSLLSYEDQGTITLYYVNQGPVIFRAIMKKDPDDKFVLFLSSLPHSIPLKNRLKDENADMITEEVFKKIDELKKEGLVSEG